MSRHHPSEDPEWRESQRQADRLREGIERFADYSQMTLFTQPKDSPSTAEKLRAFKAQHKILTHRSVELSTGEPSEVRWLAMLTPEKRLDDGGPIPPDWGLVQHMAHYCRLLDESGRTGYGPGELSAVRDLCARAQIPCTL